jgi:hypothetical protein
MRELLIVEPIDFKFGGAAPSFSVSEGSGGANLISYDPREIWIGNDLVSVKSFTIDLGQDTMFDTVYFGNTNADASSVWSLAIGTAAQGSPVDIVFQGAFMLMAVDGKRQARGPTLRFFAVALLARYIRVFLYKPAGDIIQVGNLIIGKAFRPTYNKERGAQRVPLDTGTRTRLADGSLATVSGALVSGYKWVFGDLSEAEAKALWDIVRARRTTEPMLIIEDADNLSVEGTHYCTLTDLEGYLRDDPSKNRWALTAEDWM